MSSPGLERPLRTADHFHEAIGSDVKIKTRPDYDGPRRLTGLIVDSDDHSVLLRSDTDEEEAIELADISSANMVFTWGPSPKPGRERRRPAKAETPKSETSKSETPKSETPKSETPKSETPKSETPKSDREATSS